MFSELGQILCSEMMLYIATSKHTDSELRHSLGVSHFVGFYADYEKSRSHELVVFDTVML